MIALYYDWEVSFISEGTTILAQYFSIGMFLFLACCWRHWSVPLTFKCTIIISGRYNNCREAFIECRAHFRRRASLWDGMRMMIIFLIARSAPYKMHGRGYFFLRPGYHISAACFSVFKTYFHRWSQFRFVLTTASLMPFHSFCLLKR